MKGDEKLCLLRILMKDKGYDAYIIPHGDQHNNEYIAEGDERIKFISNFSGSNGIGLVTKDIALMWTDGRYYIQIEKELYPGWKMKKMGQGEESLTEYIYNNLPKKSTISMDCSLFTHGQANQMKNKLKEYKFIDDKENLIDQCWGKLKPGYSSNKVLILPFEFSGKSVLDKYKEVDEIIQNIIDPPDMHYRMLISKLDDIAWFLNLRGNDIPYNPLFFSYALFYKTDKGFSTHLFVNKEKFNSPELKEYCRQNNIILFDYKDIIKELKNNSDSVINIVDEKTTNHRMYTDIVNSKTIVIKEDIIEKIKYVKNQTEIEGFRKANLKDSVALIKFFAWLEEELVTKNRKDLNEYQIGLENKKVRESQENYMGESFAPICGCGSNAAIIHYEQNENLHSDMNKDLILLCDTGAQYKEGTTDITRTVHYGTPSLKEKEMYTRVLLGNLSLERLIFRRGYSLYNLDSVPRSYLNMVGEDYLHATSHGVGHFLNVHEGPRGHPLKPGNIISNESGFYKKDEFGIRIENEMLVVEKGEKMLGFENLTLLPYERNLIDLSLISKDYRNYIDNYHKKVFEKLSPFLKDDQKAMSYLKEKTAPI